MNHQLEVLILLTLILTSGLTLGDDLPLPSANHWYHTCGIRYQDAPEKIRKISIDDFLDKLSNPCGSYKKLVEKIQRLEEISNKPLGALCIEGEGNQRYLVDQHLLNLEHQTDPTFDEFIGKIDILLQAGDQGYCNMDANSICTKEDKNFKCFCTKNTEAIDLDKCGYYVGDKCTEPGGNAGVSTRQPCVGKAFCYFDETLTGTMKCRCPIGTSGKKCDVTSNPTPYSSSTAGVISKKIRELVKTLGDGGSFKDYKQRCDPLSEELLLKDYKDVESLLKGGKDLLQIAAEIHAFHMTPTLCDPNRFFTCSKSKKICICKEGLQYSTQIGQCIPKKVENCKDQFTLPEFGVMKKPVGCDDNYSCNAGVCTTEKKSKSSAWNLEHSEKYLFGTFGFPEIWSSIILFASIFRVLIVGF